MNAEPKRLLLEDMRSGNYPRAKGIMRYGDKYCVLGIMANVYGKANNVPWVPFRNTSTFTMEGEMTYLTENMKKWYGLALRNPCLDTELGYTPITVIYDTQLLSLLEIADLIEAQW